MNSRELILSNVKKSQPPVKRLPDIPIFNHPTNGLKELFIKVLKTIGGEVYLVRDYFEIVKIIESYYFGLNRIVSSSIKFSGKVETEIVTNKAHDYRDVDLFITEAELAVAENSAVWITEKQFKERALPFITQHLAVIIEEKNIVGTMHDAYNIISGQEYKYATFIAGPSKTADIEQSLVLGAHGPKSMKVFIIEDYD